jgi:DNA-binding transcriptional LysR family regulator
VNKLQAINVFIQVVDSGSLSAAANKAGISSSAVTKCLSRLEDDLGTLLVNRSTRRISITENGQKYYALCKQIVADLDQADMSMRQQSDTASGLVRMIVPVSFGHVTLIPALPDFYKRFPDIVLDIHFSDYSVDLIQGSFDLAVRTGELADSTLIRRVLTKGPMMTVATPGYLARYGTPATPEDLARHNCIQGRHGGPRWTFQRDGVLFDVPVSGNLQVHSGEAVRVAARSGIGIARSTWWLFRQDVLAGVLTPILEAFAPEDIPLSVVYPGKRHMSKKILAMIDFLAEITKVKSARGKSAVTK